jgi:phasin family protein
MPKSDKTEDTGAPALTAAMMAVNPMATQAWLDLMQESSRFLTDRLQQDFETQKAMLACKNPGELLELQAEFLRSAIEQYSDYTNRFFQQMSVATQETVKGARSGRSRRYDDVPL